MTGLAPAVHPHPCEPGRSRCLSQPQFPHPLGVVIIRIKGVLSAQKGSTEATVGVPPASPLPGKLPDHRNVGKVRFPVISII